MPISLKRFNKKAAFLLTFVAIAAFFVFPLLTFAQASLGIETGAATGLGTRDLKEIIAAGGHKKRKHPFDVHFRENAGILEHLFGGHGLPVLDILSNRMFF